MKIYPSLMPLRVLQVAITIFTLLLVFAVNIFLEGLTIIMICLTILFTVIGFFTVIVYLPLYFNNLLYEKKIEGIVKNSGVYRKRSEIIKYSSIQHTTVITAPLSFNSIKFTAQGGSVILLFLNAEELRKLC